MTEKSLQDQVLERLAEEMAESLNFSVECDFMKSAGWTVLEINYIPNSGQAWNTVMDWAQDNFTGKYREHKGKWLIENNKDATMFALKWKVNPNV